jgi:ATP-dependent exoDNAse (exonuclease V) beta subunit
LAFEDPDGGKLRALLAERYLYVFGTRATVKKWKQRQNSTKEKSKTQADQHLQGSDVTDEDEDVEITLKQPSAHPPARPTAGPARPRTPPRSSQQVDKAPLTPAERLRGKMDSATANTEVPPRNTRGNKAAQKK